MIFFFLMETTALWLMTSKITSLFSHFRYTVWDSLHRYTGVKDKVSLVIEKTSIAGVDGFYAQVASEQLAKQIVAFYEMEQKMCCHGQNFAQSNEQRM